MQRRNYTLKTVFSCFIINYESYDIALKFVSEKLKVSSVFVIFFAYFCKVDRSFFTPILFDLFMFLRVSSKGKKKTGFEKSRYRMFIF